MSKSPAIQLKSNSSTLTPKRCRGCNSNIVTSDPVSCGKCLVPYHPGCARNQTTLATGGYQKCCGVKKSYSLDDIRDIIRRENDELRKALNDDSSKVLDPVKNSVDALQEKVQELSNKLEERLALVEIDNRNIHKRIDRACTQIDDNSASIKELKAKLVSNNNIAES